MQLTAIPEYRESITAKAVTVRFDHSERDGCRRCGVDGVATLEQCIDAGGRRQRLRCGHHVAGANGRTPACIGLSEIKQVHTTFR